VSGSVPGLTVNGRPIPLAPIPADERLLDTLRWRLGLRGTKEGCRAGACGSCTVLVDGASRLSCLALTHELEGRAITTIEGAADDPIARRVQEAFLEEGALQCGYCTPGFVLAIAGALRELGPGRPTAELLGSVGGNLCRCTGYVAIRRAAERARGSLR
jgi:aerobic carbon-monoxide dehydrogenase small subunit